MEPRTHARGNKLWRAYRYPSHRASMEPRTHARGNKGNVVEPGSGRSSLQWSHALTRVETPGMGAEAAACTHASMEPRTHARGNLGNGSWNSSG